MKFSSIVLAVCTLLAALPAMAEINIVQRPASVVITSVTEETTQTMDEDGNLIGDPIVTVSQPVAKPKRPAALLFFDFRDNINDLAVLVRSDTTRPKMVTPTSYVIATPGTHNVEVLTLNKQTWLWDSARTVVKLGDAPDPGPGPGPEPGDCDAIPNDPYNNLGKAACAATNVLSVASRTKMKDVAAAYRATAEALDNPGSGVLTLNDARNFLSEQFVRAFGEHRADWQLWGAEIAKHSMGVSLDRTNFSTICRTIANGLDPK